MFYIYIVKELFILIIALMYYNYIYIYYTYTKHDLYIIFNLFVSPGVPYPVDQVWISNLYTGYNYNNKLCNNYDLVMHELFIWLIYMWPLYNNFNQTLTIKH